MKRKVFLAGSDAVARGGVAHAQTIYPLTRAEILAGAKFDLKVEFPGAPEQAASRDHQRPGPRDASPASARLSCSARTAATTRPIGSATRRSPSAGPLHGRGDGRRPPRERRLGGVRHQRRRQGQERHPVHRRRHVDRPPHRRAVLSKGLVEGRYGGDLAIDDMPHMALVSTSGSDSVVTDSANSDRRPTPPATSPASTRSASTARATRARSTIPRSRPSPSWSSAPAACRSASSPTPRSRMRRRRHGRAHAPPRRLQRHRQDVLRGAAGGHPGRRLAELPGQVDARLASAPTRTTTSRSSRAHGYKFVSTKTELTRPCRLEQAARPVQHRQHRRRARPLLPQEGQRRQISRTSRTSPIRSGSPSTS